MSMQKTLTSYDPFKNNERKVELNQEAVSFLIIYTSAMIPLQADACRGGAFEPPQASPCGVSTRPFFRRRHRLPFQSEIFVIRRRCRIQNHTATL